MDNFMLNEIQLVRILASNDKKARDRAFNRLKKWFTLCPIVTPLNEHELMQIWKGLFYYLWMCDKPLLQEECAESISSLVHFDSPRTSLLFFKCGLRTLCNEWYGIDQIRLAKFLLFVRRYVRQGLNMLKKNWWNVRFIKKFNEVLSETVLKCKEAPGGLTLHFIEVYLEELAKVSTGNLKHYSLTEILRPFVLCLAQSDDTRLLNCIKRNIFHHLMKQSDAGFEYEEKFKAWKQEGFPGATIDAMQKVELPEVDEARGCDANGGGEVGQLLDPRAGHVDIELPQLNFNPKQIVELLVEHKFEKGTSLKSRKVIVSLIDDFKKLAKGRYPLGVTKVDLPVKENGYSTRTKHAVNRLVKFERKLLGKKNRKHRLSQNEKVKSVGVTLEEVKGKKRRKDNRYSFQRNSGTWYVGEADDSIKPFNEVKHDVNTTEMETEINASCSQNHQNHNTSVEGWRLSFNHLANTPPQLKNNKKTPAPDDENKSPLKRRRLSAGEGDVDTSTPNNSTEVFVQSEWDLYPKVGKVKALVKNPFSARIKRPASGGSSKKVKIDLKLNRSQEIHEHVAQIKNSPGIPFDANRRPTKPLLKATGISSPINPFYNRKLKF